MYANALGWMLSFNFHFNFFITCRQSSACKWAQVRISMFSQFLCDFWKLLFIYKLITYIYAYLMSPVASQHLSVIRGETNQQKKRNEKEQVMLYFLLLLFCFLIYLPNCIFHLDHFLLLSFYSNSSLEMGLRIVMW